MKEDKDYIIEAYETGLHNLGLEEIVVDSRKTQGHFKYKGKTIAWCYDFNTIVINYDGKEVIIDEFDFEQAIAERDAEHKELSRQTEIAAVKAIRN